MKNSLQKIYNWQAWPFKLLYAPIAPVWGWYMLKSGAVWFFTSSNPKLTFGGMEGEPKKEMYDLLPKDLYPTTINVLPDENFINLLNRIKTTDIVYPLIAKPEIGGQGILFRKIDNEKELLHYHSNVPVEYIIQKMVHYPMEVSVFYIRHPKEKKGMITGFLHKIPLQIIGDGKQTLEELVQQHPKGKKRIEELQNKHKNLWKTIVPVDEKYMLSYAANHNRGAQFVDVKEYIDDKLVSIFDNLSLSIDDFFYGRYDILCSSIDDLKNGKNFSILEFNGCGAEPNHFYDTGYTLIGAYKEILKHWKALYQISKYNRDKGVKPWPLLKGLKFLKDANNNIKIKKQADEKMG